MFCIIEETYIDKENLAPNLQQISSNKIFDDKKMVLASKFIDKYSKSVGSSVIKQPSIDEKMSELLQYIRYNNINLKENRSYNTMVSCYNEFVSYLIEEAVIEQGLLNNFLVIPTGGKRMTKRITKRMKQQKRKNTRKSRRH